MSEKHAILGKILDVLERHGIRSEGPIGTPEELLQMLAQRGMHREPEVVHLTHEDRELLRTVEGLLHGILTRLEPDRYTIRVTQENPMALGTIAPGSTGQFGAQLLSNGAPDTSGFVPSFTWTSSDPSVTFAAATTDASNGAIPLANQTVASVPTGDTLGSVTITATATDPNGATQSGSVTVAIGAGTAPATFSVGVQQLA
jgi:hypothetical protein